MLNLHENLTLYLTADYSCVYIFWLKLKDLLFSFKLNSPA